MNHFSAPQTYGRTLALTLVALFAVACGGQAETPTGPTPNMNVASPDAGQLADAGTVTPASDAGFDPDAGTVDDAGICPEGYAGPRCDQCARGWQDGNADGVCSLACDAEGELAPDCGQGQCLIDRTTDTRYCACRPGYTGEACDQCAQGYEDPDGDGLCTRACQLDCGDNGQCELAADNSESCACEVGYEGAACDSCAPGYRVTRSGCQLDLPNEAELALWLDADEPMSLTVSRGNPVDGVITWEDRRADAEALELTAPSTGQRPVYTPNLINGRGAVRFDGIDDRLSNPAFTALGGDDYTVFVMVYPRHLGNSGVLSAAHSELGTAVALDLYSPGSGVRFVHQVPGNANMRDSVQSADFDPTQPTLVGVRRWTSGLLDHIRMFGEDRGDVVGIEVDDTTLSVGNLTGALRLSLGTGLTGDALDGDIGELLIYRRALDDAEMTRVLEYLAAKWGVQ